MTADIKINGSALATNGGQQWLHDATVTEEITGAALSDTFGGVGSISAILENVGDVNLQHGTSIEVTFDTGGSRLGIIDSTSDDDGIITLSGSTMMSRLNRTIKATPITTNLGDALSQYFSKCGISVGEFSIDSSIAARSVLLPGWESNALGRLKELGAVERFEISEVAGDIVVRPVGAITADVSAATSLTFTTGENVSGLNVETHQYTYTAIADKLVYPPGRYDSDLGGTTLPGWSLDADVIEVIPGHPVILEVPVLASLSAVQQPVCMTNVGPTYSAGSAYTVVMNDGVQAVDPTVWAARGGKVTVKILPDTTTLQITIDAGNNDVKASPFRLMLSTETVPTIQPCASPERGLPGLSNVCGCPHPHQPG